MFWLDVAYFPTQVHNLPQDNENDNVYTHSLECTLSVERSILPPDHLSCDLNERNLCQCLKEILRQKSRHFIPIIK